MIMKQGKFIIIISILVIGFHIKSIAQITITSNDIPVEPGLEQTHIASNVEVFTFDVESTGPNHNWDFSQIDSIEVAGIFNYITIDPAISPFTGTNLVTDQIMEMAPGMFWHRQACLEVSSASLVYQGTKWYVDGLSDTTLFVNDPPLVLFDFPVTYQSSWNCSTIKSQYTNGELQDSHERIWDRTVDGWGQIQIPNHQYSCLRILEYDHEWDNGDQEWEIDTNFYWINSEGIILFLVSGYKTNDDGTKSGMTTYYDPTAEGIMEELPQLSNQIELKQNFPNPFNPSTTISFTLQKSQQVKLEIINVLGQHVKILFEGNLTAGPHNVKWDGKNNNGSYVTSGIYFYRLSSGQEVQTQKMVLMR